MMDAADADADAGQVPHRWKSSRPTPTPTMPRHAPRRGFLTMTIPMLARSRIEGRRRCCCRCRCWPCAASMDAADQDGTMTTLPINMRAAVFHLATLGFPRRLVFLPSTSPPETNRSALVAGSVKGGAGVRLPGFPVFVRQVTHHLPEGTAPRCLRPSPPARTDDNSSPTRAVTECPC